MESLTKTQIAELKGLISSYRKECDDFEAFKAKTTYTIEELDKLLNWPNEATEALIAKMTELNLTLNTNVIDKIEAL